MNQSHLLNPLIVILQKKNFSLLENYLKADDQGKAKLLRKYGLYDSDIKRWRDQVKNASLEVLGKRKQRSDKKSEDQIEIERLQQELQEQEKTTAKLSTLLVLQKNFRYAKKERLNLNIEEKKSY
ncbi:MAG: hypothetical protein HOP07_16095 [Bacteriovoracaceae bacterium]|nr:hypothetical protein [Bacteriovoracaceae bacterium]